MIFKFILTKTYLLENCVVDKKNTAVALEVTLFDEAIEITGIHLCILLLNQI